MVQKVGQRGKKISVCEAQRTLNMIPYAEAQMNVPVVGAQKLKVLLDGEREHH